jgi:enoyl-CoA hydratase/carnithine racemase
LERFIRLETTADGRLARLDIHRPPVNVLGLADLEDLARCVGEARGARVLVLTGLARAFSAGVEIADHVPEAALIDKMLAAMRRALSALIETPAITVASVAGACLGGGAELASACDVVLAAEDARIGFPEIRVGCFPPAAAVFLSARIGEARAAEWILTGRISSGTEAAAAGFAARAFLSTSLERETALLVEGLLSRSPQALAAARDILRVARRDTLTNALPLAESAYRKLEGSEDLARAVRDFKGRK